ncbi:MAG: hypothetical protein HKN82_16460 [Akkermansiaceae bacterium]|nr:hypothetical protein [Akkermansiaceae bacterium]NNM29146.1 hypothetical protein [Akkermansiaceae bacterium]
MDQGMANERTRKASLIASNPGHYEVCEGCESIVAHGTTVCPNCHGYRFDADPIRVVDQALILGSREQRSVTAEDLA